MKNGMKGPKAPKGFTTVGVRFPGNARVYSYLIKRGHRCKLGDELVVDSPFNGPAVVFVVRLDKNPELQWGIDYKTVDRKVVKV